MQTRQKPHTCKSTIGNYILLYRCDQRKLALKQVADDVLREVLSPSQAFRLTGEICRNTWRIYGNG